jgi:hypothetical protein
LIDWRRRHLPQAQWYNLLLDRELLRLMREPGAFRRAFGVYLGARPMQDGAVRVLPIAAFLRELAGGRVLATARLAHSRK